MTSDSKSPADEIEAPSATAAAVVTRGPLATTVGWFTAWMNRLDASLVKTDAWCERVGDRLNPLLVKETRQALKSRQFVVTFCVLLVAALGWTVVGSLSLMPRIYTTPQAQTLMTGYYIVLAIPMLLVVPLAAYRSLEGEIDDGTLELLEITTLSPWQIVLGKLASATLQMLLYFVALFPCVAYAYTLRGVDLPTTLIVLGVLFTSGLLLTVSALFFAPVARGRSGRVIILVGLVFFLFMAEWAVGALVMGILWEGISFPPGVTGYFTFSGLILSAAVCHLLLTVTAAQMTPISENRSTSIRLSLVMLTALVIGVVVYAMGIAGDQDETLFMGPWVSLMVPLMIIWAVAGSLMIGESGTMTPRIRRELPESFLARCFLSLLTPGSAMGYLFAAAGLVTLCLFNAVALSTAEARFASPNTGRMIQSLSLTSLAVTAYMIGFWGVARWMVALIRIRNNPRVEIGFAATVVVMVFAALVPYASALILSDYRGVDYSLFQFTNWAWTLSELEGRRPTAIPRLSVMFVVVTAALVFCVNLTMIGKRTLALRMATPERVLQERNREKQSRIGDRDRSPFDEE